MVSKLPGGSPVLSLAPICWPALKSPPHGFAALVKSWILPMLIPVEGRCTKILVTTHPIRSEAQCRPWEAVSVGENTRCWGCLQAWKTRGGIRGGLQPKLFSILSGCRVMVGLENREDRSSALARDKPLLPHAQWQLYRTSKSAVDAIHFWHRCRHIHSPRQFSSRTPGRAVFSSGLQTQRAVLTNWWEARRGSQGGRGQVSIPGCAVPEVPFPVEETRKMESWLLPERASQLECVTGFRPMLLMIFGTVQVLGDRLFTTGHPDE